LIIWGLISTYLTSELIYPMAGGCFIESSEFINKDCEFINIVEPEVLIENINLHSAIHIYPNPAENQFIVQFEAGIINADLLLVHVLGQLVQMKSRQNLFD